MKLLFVTGLYPKCHIDYFRNSSKGNIQNAPDTFQWAVLDGLEKNKIDYKVVSFPFIPSFPINYRYPYTPKIKITYDNKVVGDSLRFCTIAALKEISIQKRLECYLLSWIKEVSDNQEEKMVVLTYSDYSPFLQAVINVRKKHSNLVLASIITDMPDDMMLYKNNTRFLKRIQCSLEIQRIRKLYKDVDKFILLTAAMTDRILEAKDKFCVVEGIALPHTRLVHRNSKEDKTILYAGTLQEYSGVKDLVQAFSQTESKEYRLVICGKGALTPMIEAAQLKDKRIIYKGMVDRDTVLKLQAEATVLINPRKPDNIITRYSFPSKTIEYMISGTPMMGYKLDGIPSEYYDYYYTINDLGNEALTESINKMLSLSKSELDAMAFAAYDFIMENKTSEKQVKKILDFIEE